MIKKQLKILVAISLLLTIVVVALLWFANPDEDHSSVEPSILISKDFFDVMDISINNEHSEIYVVQENGGFRMQDISSEIINVEYLQQLIADVAYIEYLEKITNTSDLSLFGLAEPMSLVNIRYKDNSVLQISVGDAGPLENSRYIRLNQEDEVYLVNHASTIRFLMPIENYIDFIIVEPHQVQDVMSTISYVEYSGKLLDRPIIIKRVNNDDENEVRLASSFGVASHLMIEPTIQKVDLREAIYQFEGLVGLLNHGVAAYNADEATIKAYNLDNPDIVVIYDFSPDDQSPPTRYLLEASIIDNQGYVMVNRNGVIHKIIDEAFLSIAYEKMISRWFYTPLLLDVEQVIVTYNNQQIEFEIERLGNNEIEVVSNNEIINASLFRKLYNLIVSASHDGTYSPFSKQDHQKLLEITFAYSDDEKQPNVISYYSHSARRHGVCFEETCEFLIRDTFVDFVIEAIESIKENNDFSVSWE
mgnify:CR=1 FL=1